MTLLNVKAKCFYPENFRKKMIEKIKKATYERKLQNLKYKMWYYENSYLFEDTFENKVKLLGDYKYECRYEPVYCIPMESIKETN